MSGLMTDFEIAVALYPLPPTTGAITDPARDARNDLAWAAWKQLCDRLVVPAVAAQRAAIKAFDPQLAEESGVS
jgi:hypothetical protein